MIMILQCVWKAIIVIQDRRSATDKNDQCLFVLVVKVNTLWTKNRKELFWFGTIGSKVDYQRKI